MQSVLCTVYTYCTSAKSGIRIQKKNAQNIIHIRLLNNFVYLLISTKPRNGMKHCGKISSWEQCIYKKKKKKGKNEIRTLDLGRLKLLFQCLHCTERQVQNNDLHVTSLFHFLSISLTFLSNLIRTEWFFSLSISLFFFVAFDFEISVAVQQTNRKWFVNAFSPPWHTNVRFVYFIDMNIWQMYWRAVVSFIVIKFSDLLGIST